MEAVLEAQKAGKIRYIGFTGHKSPDIHLKMLATAAKHNFTFDSAQMPLNVMDAHFNSFEKKVLPFLLKNNIGVLGMKPLGDHFILDSKTATARDAIRSRFSSKLCKLLVASSRLTRPRLYPFWPKLRKPLKPASSNCTKRVTTSTAPMRTRSGSARDTRNSEQTARLIQMKFT